MDEEAPIQPTLKQKLKQTLCLSCCFRAHKTLPSSPSSSAGDKPGILRASSAWLKTKETAVDSAETNHEIPEFKYRFRNFFSGGGQRRHSAAGFRYDPLSYSLNFDDGYLDEAPLKPFSSRLPASPPLR